MMDARYLVLAKWSETGAATYADEYEENEVSGGLKEARLQAEDQYPDAISIQVMDLQTGGTQTSSRIMEEITVMARSDFFTENVARPNVTISKAWRQER